MPFSFKQFQIDDSECGMKVSTDSVVLAAWAPLAHAKSILDIGTGSGLLALMSAQRSQADIVGIELNSQGVQAALANVLNSPWAKRIEIIQSDINTFAMQTDLTFDHVICNPPYFLTGPQTKIQHRADARHTNTLSFEQLIKAIERLLSNDGIASLILPTEVSATFFELVAQSSLNLALVQPICSVEGKAQRRVLFTLSKLKKETEYQSALILRDKQNQYTDEMVELTKDFYLNL